MSRQKIYFLILNILFLSFHAIFLTKIDDALLRNSAVAVVFVPTILISSFWGIIIYRFRNGVQLSGDFITIPNMFGHITLNVKQIRNFKVKKSLVGVLLDYSTLKVLTDDDATSKILLPDVIISELKTKLKTNKA